MIAVILELVRVVMSSYLRFKPNVFALIYRWKCGQLSTLNPLIDYMYSN